MNAPFPWFGGKRRVADVVWRAFGNVPNYVEPFAGSLAVLLARPHDAKIETVNDADCYLANFWRSVQQAPDEVARFCDWPVNEADLHARHRWLVGRSEFRERMLADPEYFDARIAGWWVWGLSQWIGGGWCQVRETQPRRPPNMSYGGNGTGVCKQSLTRKPAREHVRNGRIVHAEARPDLQRRRPANKPNGVHVTVQKPLLGNKGMGINASRLPSLGNARGVHGAEKPPCAEWFDELRTRLRRTRVCCGDWTRVLGDSVLGTTKSRNSGMNPCAVFLDPPYTGTERDMHLYAVDDGTIAARVREWAIAHGDDPDLRIALCGYEGEHEMPPTWTKHAWKAHRGYAGEDNNNVHRERIWFSPHCLPLVDAQRSLFDLAGGT